MTHDESRRVLTFTIWLREDHDPTSGRIREFCLITPGPVLEANPCDLETAYRAAGSIMTGIMNFIRANQLNPKGVFLQVPRDLLRDMGVYLVPVTRAPADDVDYQRVAWRDFAAGGEQEHR